MPKAFGRQNSKGVNKLQRTRQAGGLVLLLAAALMYLGTLDNGLRPDELTGGDLITHQYAQVEARPSNAPGYPLYTMGGWLWFHLGRFLLGWLFNPVQILSLYSTVWGLASLLLLYLILLRVTGGQGLLALLLAAFYATTFFFWYYSVTTEQYTSAVFQTLLLVWLALVWDEQPHDSTLLWLAFVSGTMLANMVTTLFILPPLLWFILFKKAPAAAGERLVLFSYFKKPKLILQSCVLALLPGLSYAYVYIRGAQHPEWRGAGVWTSNWEWFVQFLTIQQGRDELAPGLNLQNFFTVEFPALMWQELTWPIFFGGLLGLAFLGRRRAIFLAGTLLIYFIFAWGYRFGNWFQVIIPAYPLIIIGFAAGLKRAGHWVNGKAGQALMSGKGTPAVSRALSVAVQPLLVLLLSGLLIYRFSASWPRANQHNRPDDTGLDPGWAILADGPVPPAIIASDFGERVALQYLTTIWRAGPGLYPTAAGDLDPPAGAAGHDLRIYLTRQALAAAPEMAQKAGRYPQAAGVRLIALERSPRRQLPAGAVPLTVKFGDRLELRGWEQLAPDFALPESVARRLRPANWQIALYWRTTAPLSVDYTISVRPLLGGQLISVDGEQMIQDHQPVWGAYPTSRWQPDTLVRDIYALTLPAESNPEAVQVVVYQTTGTGFENLAETTINLAGR